MVINILANGKKMIDMGKVLIPLVMEVITVDSGKMIKNTGKVLTLLLMAVSMLVNLQII